MSGFKREARYYVIKQKNLTEDQEMALCDLLSGAQIPCTDCAVVEKDWGNYEHTWKTIEHVASGKFCDPYEEIDRLEARLAEMEGQETLAQLAELMRGLEVHSAVGRMKPQGFYVLGRAIADQAKAASEPAILRKQAEAVLECAQYFGGRDFVDVQFIIEEHAKELRQAADDADKAGGGV